ncbi:MAG: hypothetical protein ACXW1C_00105, partial [Gallionella sp.]
SASYSDTNRWANKTSPPYQLNNKANHAQILTATMAAIHNMKVHHFMLCYRAIATLKLPTI